MMKHPVIFLKKMSLSVGSDCFNQSDQKGVKLRCNAKYKE